MRLLLIEDDEKVASFIAKGLRESAFVVEACPRGDEGLELALAFRYDAIMLDLMLAGMDGLTVVGELRRRGNDTPVLALTCRSSVADRIAGLDAGCDDYLTKPFAFGELLARVRALTRRNTAQRTAVASYSGLMVDPRRRAVSRDGKAIDLSNREFALLNLFMSEPGRVFTRASIVERVWGYDSLSSSNVLEVYVMALRRKIDDGFNAKLLHTVRGIGYVLRQDESA